MPVAHHIFFCKYFFIFLSCVQEVRRFEINSNLTCIARSTTNLLANPLHDALALALPKTTPNSLPTFQINPCPPASQSPPRRSPSANLPTPLINPPSPHTPGPPLPLPHKPPPQSLYPLKLRSTQLPPPAQPSTTLRHSPLTSHAYLHPITLPSTPHPSSHSIHNNATT